MPGYLFDTNIWIGAVFTTHAFHRQAQHTLQQVATPSAPAIFCRSTEQSFLRLATTPALLRAFGADGFTNRDALLALEALLALPQVEAQDEPAGVSVLWHRLASRDTASPKVWMDAYLAAFAISGGLRMVTFDRDFSTYIAQGLDLVLIE